MNITSESPVGEIAVAYPLTTRVFARHGIDFCCAGGRPIGVVCADEGIETSAMLAEIQKEIDSTSDHGQRMDGLNQSDLVDHIVKTYHVPLYEELPRLEMMARKVCDVHREKDPIRLPQLVATLVRFNDDLIQHMYKEEQVLFPMIKAGRGQMAADPIAVMHHDHEGAGEDLRKLRELTDDYVVPPMACNTWRALWHGLKALEEDLHAHVHLEENILYPRALQAK